MHGIYNTYSNIYYNYIMYTNMICDNYYIMAKLK